MMTTDERLMGGISYWDARWMRGSCGWRSDVNCPSRTRLVQGSGPFVVQVPGTSLRNQKSETRSIRL